MSLGQTASSQPQSAPSASAPSPEAPATPAVSQAANPAPSSAPAAPAANGNEPTDWRARFAGDDPKALEAFSRYKTEADFGKAFLEQRAALSKPKALPTLDEKATPAQIDEYRKTFGIPDSPDGYKITPPEGYQVSEVEKGMLSEFAKAMHGKHMTPAAVQTATEFFFQSQQQNMAAMQAMDVAKQKEWHKALEQEFGKDFEAQIAGGEAYLNKQFAGNEELKGEILNARLPGGGRLGDNPEFIKMITDLAMSNGFTDRIEANALESGGRSLSEQQSEIENRKGRYATPAIYEEAMRPGGAYEKLIGLRQSRGEIDEWGRPVQRRSA